MKKMIKRAVVCLLTAVLLFCAAPQLTKALSLTSYASGAQDWVLSWNSNKCSDMTIDTNVFYGSSNYSVRITNNDYNFAVAEKTYAVKKNTSYKFTTWVKYSDFQADPNAESTSTGARIGGAVYAYSNGCYQDRSWKKFEFDFDSGDSTTYRIGLYNGLYKAQCKGTAYFSGMKLEEVYPWNDTYRYNQTVTTVYSVDKKNVHKDAEYSIKIKNKDYNVSYVTIPFTVEKNTTYKVSAWVKCSGYRLDDGKTKDSGACISIPGNTIDKKYKEASKIAVRYSGKKWKKLEFEFDSGSETEYTIALYNGMWYADAKGTVLFSDIRIEPVYPWDSFYSYHKESSTAKVDKKRVYSDSDYSIKIVNTDYNMSYVEKTFKVKKNTRYRASVMAKCSGYQLDKNFLTDSGAAIGAPKGASGVQKYNSTTWRRIYYEFESGNNTEYTVALYNGLWNSYCKGTAWFSDFRLEEYSAKPTNQWNVLTVVFKNVKAPVEMDGKKFTYTDTLNDDDVKFLTDTLNRLYTSVPLLSGNKWGFNSIDVVSSNAVINELKKYGENGYCLDSDSGCVSRELDRILEEAEKESGKTYNQIIAVAPLSGVAGDWWGLGGGKKYNGISFCQVQHKSGNDFSKWYKNFHEAIFVHEMLHCVNDISDIIDPDRTELLHSNVDVYGEKYYNVVQSGWDNWGAWLSDYMRSATPSGKGIVPESYNVYNSGIWKVIYGSENEKPAKTDIASLTISKPSDCTYTGEAITPEITVTDGKQTLVKGTDYTLTYLNNTEIGLGAIIVEGKGKYTGKCARTFRINPKETTLIVTGSDGKYSLSWESVKGANNYILYCSADGGETFTLLKIVDGEKESVFVDLDSTKSYIFKILCCTEIYPQKFYSGYSNAVKK